MSIKTIIDTGADKSIINNKQLSFIEPLRVREFSPGQKPSLSGAFSDSRSEVLGQVDLLVAVDNVFKNITVIVLNNGNFSLILEFLDIKKLGLQIIEAEVLTQERRVFGHDLLTEIDCLQFETVQTY